MKLLHRAELSVFVKEYEGDNEASARKKLLSLVPFSLEEEKIELERKTAKGFQENKIIIFTVKLEKQRHLGAFLEHMLNRLTKEQKELLLRQKESRLDSDLNFFIRFDKQKLAKEDELFITDSGDCFHIKMSIAAFPAKRDKALAIIEKIFKGQSN